MTLAISEISTGKAFELAQPSLEDKDVPVLIRWLAKPQKAWAAFHDDDLLAVWGLIPPTLLSEVAYLWMITFPAAEEHKFIFMRRTKVQIEQMLELYPTIIGDCEASASRSIRWLRYMGAEFTEEHNGLLRFVIRKHHG